VADYARLFAIPRCGLDTGTDKNYGRRCGGAFEKGRLTGYSAMRTMVSDNPEYAFATRNNFSGITSIHQKRPTRVFAGRMETVLQIAGQPMAPDASVGYPQWL
jgi:hypothetical protein